MKANQNTVLIGSNVVLVPYHSEHVPKYHEWMCNEELRTLTASEPLSLGEEYEMQQKWLLDDDKLTFIILGRTDPYLGTSGADTLFIDSTQPLPVSPMDPTISALPMIGDVNIFLNGKIPKYVDSLCSGSFKESDQDEENYFEAEVEIMIAEPKYRRRGLALETLQLMLTYATGAPRSYFRAADSTSNPIGTSSLHIPPECLVTRISESNIASIRLFEKLGFRLTKRVEVFHEVEMRWFRSDSTI